MPKRRKKLVCESFNPNLDRGVALGCGTHVRRGVAIIIARRNAQANAEAAAADAADGYECKGKCEEFDSDNVKIWNPPLVVQFGPFFCALVAASWELDILCVLTEDEDEAARKRGFLKRRESSRGSRAGDATSGLSLAAEGRTRARSGAQRLRRASTRRAARPRGFD